MTIRVLLADDHPVVRRGLAALLGTLDEFEVVAKRRTARPQSAKHSSNGRTSS